MAHGRLEGVNARENETIWEMVDAAPTDNEGIRTSLYDYIETGEASVGHFLRGLLSNDFVEVTTRADSKNQQKLYEWAIWMYNYPPASCWGSFEAIKQYEGFGQKEK